MVQEWHECFVGETKWLEREVYDVGDCLILH